MDELSKRLLEHEPISFKTVAGTGKAQKSFKHVELPSATCYAAEDADVTLRIWEHLRPRLAHEKLLTVYETLERPLPKVLVEMELAGIRVDPERLRLLSNDFATRMGELEAEAHKVAGRPFNLGAPKQIGDLLFTEMGLASGRHHGDRRGLHRRLHAGGPGRPGPRTAAHPAGLAPAVETERDVYG